MREEIKDFIVKGKKIKIKLLYLEEKDRSNLGRLYNYWRMLDKGLKIFRSRGITIPEGISEGAFCIAYNTNCARVLKVQGGAGSFDAFEIKTKKRIQIKATSVKEDLTSFGPKSVWDELYFLDFYRSGDFDGTFDVYKIPNSLIYNHHVNKKQTFKDQQKEGRRPRLCIKSGIISKNNIKPLKTCKI